jgi:regulator of sigma E protease
MEGLVTLWLANFWNYIGTFLIVLTVLVFVHELGHYLVARWNGVRVEIFSIGFGRELLGWTDKSGTRWKICWLPLGGYVKFYGDAGVASNPGEVLRHMTPDERAVSFHHKPLGARAAVVAAGPIANFLLAIVLLAGLFMFIGQRFTPAEISGVQEESPAAAAGFQPGDRIVRIDGTTIERFEELQQIVEMSPGKQLVVTVRRGGEDRDLTVTPRSIEMTDAFGTARKIGRLGVSRAGGVEFKQHNPASAVWAACREVVNLTVLTMHALGEMIVGARPPDDLSGPIGIANISGKMAERGFVEIVLFTAFLSLNLGLVNLFPIPVLDGGHLLFYAFEWLRGRPPGERAQEYGFRVGLAVLLAIFVFATWQDLKRLAVFKFVTGLFS